MTTPSAPDERTAKPHAGWRTFWLALAVLLAYAEVAALRLPVLGDTLSETVWWLYGPQYGWRWWLIGGSVSALLLWTAAHWLWPSIGGAHLAYMVGMALIVGAVGAALT